MDLLKSEMDFKALVENNQLIIEANENPDPSLPLIHQSVRQPLIPAPLKVSRVPRRYCLIFTRFRIILLGTSLASILVVLIVQCMFWNFSPILRACCGRQESGAGVVGWYNVSKTEEIGGWGVAARHDISRQAEIDHRKRLSKKWRKKKERKLGRRHKDNDKYYIDTTQEIMKQRYPQCIIIGVRKGGTRALLEFLSLHPQVATHRAEIHFFDNEDNYAQGLEWYRTSMPRSSADQVTIEKTPAYFVGEAVPERIYAMNRSIRLLLIVRDPVERAISDYDQIRDQKLRHNKPEKSFEDLAIDAETGRVNEGYTAIRRSVYHRYMSAWLRLFSIEQFHLVSGEELVKDPLTELKKVETFLNLPPRLNEDMFYLNKTRGFYCMRNINGQQERCLARSKGREHPYVSPRVIDKLREYYRPHNQRFYQMVGRDFGWP